MGGFFLLFSSLVIQFFCQEHRLKDIIKTVKNAFQSQAKLLQKRDPMEKLQKEALQVAKELVAKFIETRTISPGNFAETFPAVYKVVLETITQETTKE